MAKDTPTDFEALARQYWSAWGDAMRAAGVPAAGASAHPGMQGWHEAVDWWTRLAHGGRADVDAAVGRFSAQTHDWYGKMQQVAAQFAGQQAGAGDIADAWKQALGAAGDNPENNVFPEMLRGMCGQGLQGMEQWVEDASPMLDAWKREGASWLGMPAFGVAREHQQRWQALAQAQLDYQERSNACNALMTSAGQRAFELFEGRLGERAASGDKLESARALFDLWIDAAEEAYADVALSPEYRKAYGALVNAQMRLRAGVQREVEQTSGQFGMPTRTEVDAAHRKIAELERELRRLRDAVEASAANMGPRRSAGPSPRPSPEGRGSKAASLAAKRTTEKSAAKKTTSNQSARKVVKKPVAKKTAKRTVAGKPAAKKTASKASARKTERKPALKQAAPARGKPARTATRKR